MRMCKLSACMHTCSIGIVKISSPFRLPLVCAHILWCILFLISVCINNFLSNSGYYYRLFWFLQTQNVLKLLKIKRRTAEEKINEERSNQTMKMKTRRRFAWLTYLILTLSLRLYNLYVMIFSLISHFMPCLIWWLSHGSGNKCQIRVP